MAKGPINPYKTLVGLAQRVRETVNTPIASGTTVEPKEAEAASNFSFAAQDYIKAHFGL